MNKPKSLAAILRNRDCDSVQLAELTGLDRKIIDAIAAGRYTTSPKQRERIAAALKLSPDDIRWGAAVEVDHMYGHGPQFGRSP